MTSVEKVLKALKDKNIAVSRMERDLGFGNGYIKQLKKGSVPADRLYSIADYLGLPFNELLSDEKPHSTMYYGETTLIEPEKAATPKDDGLAEVIRLYNAAPAWMKEQALSFLKAGVLSVGIPLDTDSKDK